MAKKIIKTTEDTWRFETAEETFRRQLRESGVDVVRVDITSISNLYTRLNGHTHESQNTK